MHIQIINFNLRDMSDDDYRATCEQLAPAFASVPGLMSKVWLEDAASNRYGGVYFWSSREAMTSFANSELFEQVKNHPNLVNITSTDFGVLERPTEITRGFTTRAA